MTTVHVMYVQVGMTTNQSWLSLNLSRVLLRGNVCTVPGTTTRVLLRDNIIAATATFT
jgi:hypothetical protein